MPNTNPPIDNTDTIRYILEKAEHAKARVYPVCTITRGMKGTELSDFAALKWQPERLPPVMTASR